MLNFLNGLVASASAGTIDWSTIVKADSFDGMLSGISTVLPIVVPVGLTILGVGVVWRITKKMAKG